MNNSNNNNSRHTEPATTIKQNSTAANKIIDETDSRKITMFKLQIIKIYFKWLLGYETDNVFITYTLSLKFMYIV